MNKYEVFNEKTGALIRVDWDHDPSIRPPLPDGCSLRLVEQIAEDISQPASPAPEPEAAPMPAPAPSPDPAPEPEAAPMPMPAPAPSPDPAPEPEQEPKPPADTEPVTQHEEI